MPFILSALAAFAAAVAMTPVVRRLATRLGVVDRPGDPRKVHKAPVPLLGGLAVAAAFAFAVAVAVAAGWLPGEHIREKYLVGALVAVLLLVFGGALDDALNLKPSRQVVWPALAALAVIGSGIGVAYVTNPFGGQLILDRYAVTVLWWQGIPYKLTLLADLFTFAWLLGMTYTTKFLDGLDGLVSGIAVIGAFVIAVVSLTKEVSQPDTAILACIVGGAFLGFLLFNVHPAKIFLGEGGSTLAGFLLGVLAIISGGKIATTLLILGLPLFDAALVIARRVISGRPPTSADRSHLHFLLLDLGLSHRQAVLFFWFIAALAGTSTLILRGWQKLAALGVLMSVLVAVSAAAMAIRRKKVRK